MAGDLTATVSGSDLMLSFPTTTTNYYGVQTSPDLLKPWTNIQAGLQGFGFVKTITLSNALDGSEGFFRTMIHPQPVRLQLSQGSAFAIIGYDCGGIQEQVYLTGFDPTNGYPIGIVDLKTVCSCGKDCSTTHTAGTTAMWDFAGNVITTNVPVTGGPTSPAFIATDGFNDIIYNVGTIAYLVVPIPATPTGVAAVQSGDQFNVSWTPNGVNPIAITSSTLMATPVSSTNTVLTATVTGPATNGIIPTLEPSTTYQITVVSTTIGGSSPASVPISVLTSPATILPSAPTNVFAQWANLDPVGVTNDTLEASWSPSVPGNSPVDQYLVTITGSDGAGTFYQTVAGTTTNANFTVDFVPNWSVTVQAHNAAGWGATSNPYMLGGL